MPEDGMVQKRPFSGNTRDLSANPDRFHVGAGVREFLAALLELRFREKRSYELDHEFYYAYSVKWHFLAPIGTVSEGLCLRKPIREMN